MSLARHAGNISRHVWTGFKAVLSDIFRVSTFVEGVCESCGEHTMITEAPDPYGIDGMCERCHAAHQAF